MKTLPSEPSELLMLALMDLEKIENTPGYVIDMGMWHEPRGGFCHVCLAGAVLAETLNKPMNWDFDHFSMTTELHSKLNAINNLRTGDVVSAVYELDFDLDFDFYSVDESLNLGNLSIKKLPAWLLYMQDLIGFLKAEGL